MADLMVGRPDGSQFWVDVKGVKGHNSIFQHAKDELKHLYYLIVCVGETRDKDEFFVLKQQDFNALIHAYAVAHPNDHVPGFTFKYVLPFKDKWDALSH